MTAVPVAVSGDADTHPAMAPGAGMRATATAVTAAMGFLVGFRLHGSAGEALLAFALCVICGFAFLWLFICMGLVSANAQAAQGTSMVIYPSSSSPAPMCRSTPCPAGCNPSPNTSPSPSCPTRCAR
jgi:hypothetical protein